MEYTFATKKKAPDQKKMRGEYYTPSLITDYIVQWALSGDFKRILEPSCGDGNFIESVFKKSVLSNKIIELTAVEINKPEIDKARQRFALLESEKCKITWINSDFFDYYMHFSSLEKFDVILGNPPFIRFQYFDDSSREKAFASLRNVGYKPTKLANAWSAFVQLSIELLKEGGRLAMVLPAELLQVQYSKELRNKIANHFQEVTIISFKNLVFKDIQQETIILLAKAKSREKIDRPKIRAIEIENEKELASLDISKPSFKYAIKSPAALEAKWTSFFLQPSSLEALLSSRTSPLLKKIKDFAAVDVGVVTGRNSFFVLKEELVDYLKVKDFVLPVVGKTSALKSISFELEDFEEYKRLNFSYILNLKNRNNFPTELLNYIKTGEDQQVHKGYKCSIRSNWYEVPSIYVPDAFMFRQIHLYPLIVKNKSNVTSTDTIHRVRFKKPVNQSMFCAAAFNSLTLAYSEILGRSYGGGVLELEPSEAEELPIFYDDNLMIDTEKVYRLLKQGAYIEALDYVDSIVLSNSLGFEKSCISKIRSAWIELRDRRTNRK